MNHATIGRRAFLRQAGIFASALAIAPAAKGQENGVRPAPNMPAPKFIETNGIRMTVYEQGDGKPIVFSHGFPELAYSWRNQIKALSGAGYRAIAPDQRGYGLTDRPEAMESYDLKHLCDDMAGMLDELGIDKAVFCGHDWGGGVVWSMVRLHPERCLGVIGVNTPCQRPPTMPLKKKPEPPLIVMTENYYVNQFQEPGRAEKSLSKDVRKTFNMILRKGDIWNVERFKALPEDSPERQLNLLGMLERDTFPGEPLLPKEEVDYYVDTFEKTGFTGGLNWYRAAKFAAKAFANAKWQIDVPCLYVGAENDVILRPSSADGMEDFIPDLEKYTVKDCGHWTQQEKAEELNRVVIDWMNRKIGKSA